MTRITHVLYLRGFLSSPGAGEACLLNPAIQHYITQGSDHGVTDFADHGHVMKSFINAMR